MDSPDDHGSGETNVKTSFANLVKLHESGAAPTSPRWIEDQQSYQTLMKAGKAGIVAAKADLALFYDQSGWSAARDAMVVAADKCRALGVRFQAGLVRKMIIEDDDVRGVACADGQEVRANKLTVLAAGS